MAKQLRKLTHDQFYEICEEMKIMQIEGKIDLWPRELAAAFERLFGYEIAESSIKQAAKVTGTQLKQAIPGGKPKSAEIECLQQLIAELERRVSALESSKLEPGHFNLGSPS